jgi:hypothetical protein
MKTFTPPPPTPATHVECPWCADAVDLATDADEIACPACRIRVDIAPDSRSQAARLAAA